MINAKCKMNNEKYKIQVKKVKYNRNFDEI